MFSAEVAAPGFGAAGKDASCRAASAAGHMTPFRKGRRNECILTSSAFKEGERRPCRSAPGVGTAEVSAAELALLSGGGGGCEPSGGV